MAIKIINTSDVFRADGKTREVFVQFSLVDSPYLEHLSGAVRAGTDFYNWSTSDQHQFVLDKVKQDLYPEPFNEDKIAEIDDKVNELAENVREEESVIKSAVRALGKQILKSEISEEEYLEIISIYDEWRAENDYTPGMVVRHEGKAWEVIQMHTSQADWPPKVVPALFKEVTPKTVADPETGEEVEIIADFVQPTGAHDAYSIGDKVMFEGKTYESLIGDNVHSPADYPQGWSELEGVE